MFQKAVDPLGMIRMAVRQTNPHKTQLMLVERLDHSRRVIRGVDHDGFAVIMNDVPLNAIAAD